MGDGGAGGWIEISAIRIHYRQENNCPLLQNTSLRISFNESRKVPEFVKFNSNIRLYWRNGDMKNQSERKIFTNLSRKSFEKAK